MTDPPPRVLVRFYRATDARHDPDDPGLMGACFHPVPPPGDGYEIAFEGKGLSFRTLDDAAAWFAEFLKKEE